MKKLLRSPRVQAALGFVLAVYMILVRRTVRWRQENLDCTRELLESPDGALGLFWHGRILLCLGATETWWKRPQRRCLVSPSADGEFIAQAFGYAGYPAIRGSSAKQGDSAKARAVVAAFREAVAWVKGGGVLIVTPDGPRGPNEVIAAGSVQIARRSGAMVYVMGMAASPAIQLKTWDRFMLPAPFGKGAIVWVGPLRCPPDADDAMVEALTADWSAQLSAATRRAEALVGRAPKVDPAVPQ